MFVVEVVKHEGFKTLVRTDHVDAGCQVFVMQKANRLISLDI